MARRDYGSGSLRELPDGRWQGRVDLGRDGQGRRLRPTFTGTKREVQAEIAKAIREREAGVVAVSGRLTVAAYLDQWLEQAARPRLRPHTFASYAAIVRKHLIPSIGHVRLAKLGPAHVQAVVQRPHGPRRGACHGA